MNNLYTAIMTKTSGSSLSSYVGGRIYEEGSVPQGVEYPYVVFGVVTDSPDDTWTNRYEDITIQFSLFSTSAGASELTTMYGHLKTLFDNCTFTLTGGVLKWFERTNLMTMVDDLTTPDGTYRVRHWAVDYNVCTKVGA